MAEFALARAELISRPRSLFQMSGLLLGVRFLGPRARPEWAAARRRRNSRASEGSRERLYVGFVWKLIRVVGPLWIVRVGRGSGRSWHSTTELLPHSCVFRYLTVRQGFSRFRGQSIPSRKSIPTMGSDRKMDSKMDSKPGLQTDLITGTPTLLIAHYPLHDTHHDITTSGQRDCRPSLRFPIRVKQMFFINIESLLAAHAASPTGNRGKLPLAPTLARSYESLE